MGLDHQIVKLYTPVWWKGLEDHSFIFIYLPAQTVIPIGGGSARVEKYRLDKRGFDRPCLEF